MEIKYMPMAQLLAHAADLGVSSRSAAREKKEVFKQLDRIQQLHGTELKSDKFEVVTKETTKYTVDKALIPDFLQACYVYMLAGVVSALDVSVDKSAFNSLGDDDRKKLAEFVDEKKTITRKVVEIEGLDD